MTTKKRYPIITLCGSTKFKDDFIRVQKELTLKGNVVISVGLFGHADKEFGYAITPEIKEMLDDIHKQKIDISDGIYVINKGGYIGESTKSEIDYAMKHGKFAIYMEEQYNYIPMPGYKNARLCIPKKDEKVTDGYNCFICKEDIPTIDDLAGSNCGIIKETVGTPDGMIHSAPVGDIRHFCKKCCPNGIPAPDTIHENILLREIMGCIERSMKRMEDKSVGINKNSQTS